MKAGLPLQVLKEVMGNDVLWYMEGHSVACSNQFREYLGILTTQFGFGVPDYQAQSEMDGAYRNDERQAIFLFSRYHPKAKLLLIPCPDALVMYAVA